MSHPRLLALAQLVRLPNVFTVWADIGLGALVTGALPEQAVSIVWLLLASTFLYWAGMVWNDYFDLEQDSRERPFRPLASGRVGLGTARLLGIGLLLAGLGCAALAGCREEEFYYRPLVLASVLAVLVLLYDGWLKRTWLGPLVMGGCRFLNVLLGLSVAVHGFLSGEILLALVVGLYITGVTWFARTEARVSQQSFLLGAAGLMLLAVLLSLAVPLLTEEGASREGASQESASRQQPTTSILFPYLVVVFCFYVGAPLSRAIVNPQPGRVQSAVKRAVLGLILLDAILASAMAGTGALLLALLIVPALTLGRWLYST